LRFIYIILFLSLNSTLFSQGIGLSLNKFNKSKDEPLPILQAKHEELYKAGIQKPSTSACYAFNNPFRYKDELGFFCKVELKWDKVLYRPLRFRLGSYEYVNRLEGK
jgi:hypothetical protein